MAKIGRVVIDLVAGTAGFTGPMGVADAQMRRFGDTAATGGRRLQEFDGATRHAATTVQAISGDLRVMEGGFTNSLRAAERFLASIKGIGPIAQALFPAAGGIALLGILDELIQHVNTLHLAFQKMREAPQQIAQSARELIAPLKEANDELDLTNAKLENEIAKLGGKPENGIKTALIEAQVEADKLGKALDDAFKKYAEDITKKKGGFFTSLITGAPRSEDLSKEFGNGPSGDYQGATTGFPARIQKIIDDGQQRLQAIQPGTTPEQNLAASQQKSHTFEEIRNQLEAAYREELKKTNDELRRRQQLQKAEAKPALEAVPFIGPLVDKSFNVGHFLEPDPQAKQIGFLQAASQLLTTQQHTVESHYTNEQLSQQRNDAQIKADADALVRPYQDKLKELDAELIGLKQNLASIGKGEVGITLANSFAESQKQIAKLNDDLAKKNAPPLTRDQETIIQTADDENAITKAEVEWKTKLDSTTTSIQERIQSLKLLTAAIGEGYEAQKKASVETQLIEKFGKQYNDEQFLDQNNHREEINQERTRLNTGYDVNQQKTVTESVDKISTQIELEESLARAESKGAEAVRQATLQHQLSEIAKNNSAEASKKLSDAETALANSEQSVKASATLAQLQQEIDATNRLTAAQTGGADAVRRAQLANRVEEIRRTVPEQFQSEEIQKTTQLSQSQHNQQVVSESLKTGLNYQNRLSELSQEITYLKSIKGTKDETLATDISLKEAEKEQVQVLSQQAQVLGTARDGLRSFFEEMSQQGVSAAKEVHDALRQTFDSLNDQLAKAISGQKTNWASFFQGISADIAKASLHNLEATIAGKFAGPAGHGGGTSTPGAAPGAPSSPHGILQTLGAAIFGKPAASGALGKRDGNSPSTALFVTTVDGQTAANPAPSVSAAPAATAGEKPDLKVATPDLSSVNRLPQRTLGDIPNLTKPATKSVATTGAQAQPISLPEAIAKFEGFNASPGNLPTRNNNPGDIKFGPFAQSQGATKDEHSPFAKFPDAQSGTHAITSLLQTPGYQNLTIKEAIERWNGKAAENNPEYVAAVSKMTGKSSDTPLSQVIPQPEGKPGLFGIHLAPGTSLSNAYTDARSDTTNIDSSELSQLEFGGFRADGGDVDSDQVHVVGEDGPELFIPGADGTIVSNDKLKEVFNATSSSESANTLPAQSLPDVQMGDVQGALPDFPTNASRNRLKEFFQNEFHQNSKTHTRSLDQLADQNARANTEAAQQGSKPGAFDKTRQAMKIAALSLATQPAGNQWLELAHGVEFGLSTAAAMAGKGGGASSGISGPAPNPNPNSFASVWNQTQTGFKNLWQRTENFFGGKPNPGSVGTGNQVPGNPNAGYTLSPEPSGSGLIMRSPSPAAVLTREDQSNLGDFNNSELGQLDNSSDGTWPSFVKALGGKHGGGISASTGLAIGGMALGLLGRIFGQPGDHHFRPGNAYTIPNFNGAYAAGGDVDSGKTHLVGEKGPELFVPKSDGTIIPNHKLSEFKSSSMLTEAANGGGTHTSAMRLSELKHSNVEKSFNSIGSGLPFGGYRAMGGAVDPNSSYMVGEQGPEMFTPPGNGGTIVPNDKLTNNSPSQTVYVDARGTDPAAVEQRIRQGMQATHNASVRTSFKSYQEYQQRTPQKR